MLFVFHTHREIKIKLLAVFLAALVPFLIFIFYLFDLWYDTRRQLVIEENVKTTRLLSLSIDHAFRTTQAMASFFTERNISQTFPNQVLFSVIAEKMPVLDSFSLFDRDGTIIATSMDITAEQQKITVIDEPYFKKALNTRQAVSSGVHNGKYYDHRVVNFLSPIVVDNEVQSVVSATYNLERLKSLLEAVIGDTAKPIILLDHEGTIAFRLYQPIAETKDLDSIATNQYVQAAIQGQESVFEYEEFPGMPKDTYIGTATPIGTTSPHWVVVSMQSTKDIFAPLISLQNSMWIILVSAFVFSFLLISFILRKIRIIY